MENFLRGANAYLLGVIASLMIALVLVLFMLVPVLMVGEWPAAQARS